MKLSVWLQQQCCRRLLIRDTGISPFPLSHHVYAVRVSSEGESIAAVGRPKVNGCDYKVLVLSIGGGRATAGITRTARDGWPGWGVLVRKVTIFAPGRHFFGPRMPGRRWLATHLPRTRMESTRGTLATPTYCVNTVEQS
jgi:hypothetical protein